MTLIAALKPRAAMLLGDLLISERHRDGRFLSPFKPTLLPSVGLTVPPDPNSSSQIVTTRQKLVLITDNLAIGWSGPYSVAKRIVTAMLDHFSPGSITYEEVDAFYATCDYDDLHRSGIRFVGICSDNDKHTLFGRNANMQVDLPYFDTSFVAGSGSRTFVDLCSSLAGQGIVFPSPESGAPVDHLKALYIMGHLTAFEIYNPENLYTTFFGGFYETIVMFGKHVTKLGNIAFTYSQFILDRERSNSAVIFYPLIFIKMDYVNDVLLIRRIHIKYDEIGQSSKEDQVLVAQPIYRDVSRDEVDGIWKIDMNAEHYCHVIFVQEDNNRWSFIINLETSQAVRNVEIVEEEDGRQTFMFTEEFFLKTTKLLRERGVLTAHHEPPDRG